MKDCIIIDMDGTVCDIAHRVHWAQAKEWDKFHAGIPDDKVREDAFEFIWRMSSDYNLIICTGRNEAERTATEDWLLKNNLASHITEILMRPDNCRESDDTLKVRLVDEYFGNREEALKRVLLILDDRDRVVQAFRDAGFTCWQVAAGSY